jgi:magnesium transporter
MRLSTLIGPELKTLIAESPEQLEKLLEEAHPEDVADVLGDLDAKDAAAAFGVLPASLGAPIFERLANHEQVTIATLLPLEKLAAIAAAMATGRRSHLARILPDDLARGLRDHLLVSAPGAAADLLAMTRWKPGTAGYLMSTRFVTARPQNTVAEALEAMRLHGERTHETFDDLYVIGTDGRVAGKVALRDLAFAAPSRTLADLYQRKIVSVTHSDSLNEVARRMAKYDLHAVPVIDGRGALRGMIPIDDVIVQLTKETTQEVQRIGAVEPLDVPYFRTSFLSFIRKRGVWLVILFIEEFLTQTTLRFYDPVFEAIKGASYYVPLLISTGGNSGAQSSTLVIRGLTIGEIRLRDWWRILYRETGMGLALGVGLGAVGFLRVLMYRDQHIDFAITVAVTLVGIVTTGCTVGSMLPLLLRRLGIDPATSSTPFIASLVDVIGIIVFVHVAKLIMASALAAHGGPMPP